MLNNQMVNHLHSPSFVWFNPFQSPFCWRKKKHHRPRLAPRNLGARQPGAGHRQRCQATGPHSDENPQELQHLGKSPVAVTIMGQYWRFPKRKFRGVINQLSYLGGLTLHDIYIYWLILVNIG